MVRPFLAIVVLAYAWPTLVAQQPEYPPPAEVRTSFLKLLDRPKVPADVKLEKTTPQPGDWMLEEFTFASEKKADNSIERVPVILLRPAKVDAKMPAVVVLHGTGGNRFGVMNYLKELQARGIIGVAIDARYHGQRSGGAKGADAYNRAIIAAWQTKPGQPMEHPFYYDTVWDLWRLIDVLSGRPDIDADRLGMIGFSMGGIQTWLAASVDERVRVTVPAIAVQSFRWSLLNEQWQGRAKTILPAHEAAAKDMGEAKVNAKVCAELWNKLLPGILDQYDCPSMLRLFAGRPLLILNGTTDANCPIEGAKIAIASAKKSFADAKADEKFAAIIANIGHTVTPEQQTASLEWFERWLCIKARKAQATLEGHTDRVLSLAFGPSGKTLASGSDDNAVKLWDVATGKSLTSFEREELAGLSVAFSPDGKTLASGGRNGKITLRVLATGKLESVLIDEELSRSTRIVYSPNGKTLASGGMCDFNVIRWNVTTGKKIATLELDDPYGASDLVFSLDSKTLTSINNKHGIRLWNIATGKSTLAHRIDFYCAAAFSPDGQTVATSDEDSGDIKIWKVATGKELAAFKGHSEAAWALQVSPDGKTLASGRVGGTINLWDVATGKNFADLQGHTERVVALAFSPDGTMLASGSEDKTIKLWSTTRSK